jgi:hypothetical protein
VKVALLSAWLLALLPVQAGDWRDSLTSPRPGKFPPLAPLKANYQFGWGSLNAASAEFVFSKTPSGDLRLTTSTATTGAVRALWRMDARSESICRASSLRPVSLVQTETYRDESHRTRADFDAEGVSRIRERQPLKGKPAKIRRFEWRNVFNLQTALLFVRSQPLRQGESYSFIVYPATDPYLARVTVLGREKVKTPGRTGPAIKVGIQLQSIDKKLELVEHQKFKRGTAWLSDDADRILVKATAEVFVGSVWVELEKLTSAGARPASGVR